MEKVSITGRIEEIERRPNSLYGNPKFRIHLGCVSDCFILGEQKHITNQVVVETEANSGEAYKIHTGMEGSVATFHCHITPKRRTNIIDSFTLGKDSARRFRDKRNAERSFEPVSELPKTSAALNDLRRSIDGLKGALGTSPQALRLRAKRNELLSQDIANADRYDQTMKHLTDRVERIRNSLRGDK